MVLSKLFSKKRATKRATKMSMTDVLLSNSNSGNGQDPTEKAGAGRIRIDAQPDGTLNDPTRALSNRPKEIWGR